VNAPAYVLGLTNGGLAVVRSLSHAKIHVFGVDSWMQNVGCASRLCTLRIGPPATHEEELIAFLLREGEQLSSPGVLIFAKDEFAVFASRHREALSKYFRFVLPEKHVSEAMVDKQAQYELAERLRVPYPPIYNVRTARDLDRLLNEIEYPVLIKPVHAHLWRKRYQVKLFKAYNAAELKQLTEDILPTGLEIVLQSFVPGPPTNLRILCGYISQQGELLGSYVVEKIRQYPPEFGEAALAVTVDDPQVHDLGLQFALGVGFRGPFMVEFKRDDRTGVWKLMELNPRFWSHTALGPSVGSDLPMLNYLDAAGRNPAPQVGYRVGVHWLHTTRDVMWFQERGKLDGTTLPQLLWSWRKARSHGAFAWNDPRPLFTQSQPLVQSLRRAVRSRMPWLPAAKRLLFANRTH
jgi:D-aspartate ligase